MQIIQDHSQYLRFSQGATSYMFAERVLHPPLSQIPVTHNLMQVSVRDFSISKLENIPQNKTILMVCLKKQGKARTLS